MIILEKFIVACFKEPRNPCNILDFHLLIPRFIGGVDAEKDLNAVHRRSNQPVTSGFTTEQSLYPQANQRPKLEIAVGTVVSCGAARGN